MGNQDELNYRKFTTKSEADKALNSLKGLLVGISMDGIIDDCELKELDIWCEKHHNLIKRNPFKEFMTIIRTAIREPENRIDLVEDLNWLSQKYDNDNIYYNAVTAELQTLQGICHGILSNGKVEDKEVLALDEWLDEHEFLASYYPYDEIKSLLTSVLADGIIDEQERKRLSAYFSEFVDISNNEIADKIKGGIIGVEISGVCTSEPSVLFKDKTFCFTGVSERGSRKEISEMITKAGGIFSSSISKKTDYLIVGDNSNPCWAFACYGRKVEKAINLRKNGSRIQIIHEYDFWDFYEDSK